MPRASSPQRPRPRRLREMRSRPPAPRRRPVSRLAPPRADWLPSEKWAWSRIRQGKPADFNDRYGFCPLPTHHKTWDATRIIRPDFLRDILLHSPWKDAVPPGRLEIIGAWIPEGLLLPAVEIGINLALFACRFEGEVNFQDTRFSHGLYLNRSFVGGQLAMDGAKIGSNLFMDQGEFQETRLHGVEVGGDISLNDATFEGLLAMDGAKIGGSLFMDHGKFQETRLLGVEVRGQIAMEGATSKGPLVMDGVKIGGYMFMRGGKFQETRLLGVEVGGDISLSDATFKGLLAMDGAKIGGSLFMRGGKFQETRLHGVEVRGQIAMEESTFEGALWTQGASAKDIILWGAKCVWELNLNYTTIRQTLALEGLVALSINLRHTTTTEVRFGWRKRNTKTNRLFQDGFTYEQITQAQPGDKDQTQYIPTANITAQKLIDILALQKEFSPQPYRQLARVLRRAGAPGKANKVLYACRERERKDENTPSGRKVWLWWLRCTIGYGLGLRPLLAAVWTLGLAAFGTFVLLRDALFYLDGWGKFAFSLDALIPFLTLTDHAWWDSLAVFHPWLWRIFFFGYQLLGAVLIFFVVLGVTGLADRDRDQ